MNNINYKKYYNNKNNHKQLFNSKCLVEAL